MEDMYLSHVALQLYAQLCLQELMRWLSWLKVLAAQPGDPCSIPGTCVVAGENFLLHLSSDSHMHIISHSHAQMSTYVSLSSRPVRIAISKLWHFALDFTLFIITQTKKSVTGLKVEKQPVYKNSPVWPGTYSIPQDGLKFAILLPQCSEPFMPEINTMCLFTVLELVN